MIQFMVSIQSMNDPTEIVLKSDKTITKGEVALALAELKMIERKLKNMYYSIDN